MIGRLADWREIMTAVKWSVLVVLLLGLPAQEVKADYSRCIPKGGLNPGEFTLGSKGKLAVNQAELVKYSHSENEEVAERKMPGQSGIVKATLRREGGRPVELVETYPVYDSVRSSYQVNTFFKYSGEECYVDAVKITYFDGQHRNRKFIQFDRALCEEMHSANTSTVVNSKNPSPERLARARLALESHQARVETQGFEIRALRDKLKFEKVSVSHLEALVNDCKAVGARYPGPRGGIRKFFRNIIRGGSGPTSQDNGNIDAR
jgi:hypothetical protein